MSESNLLDLLRAAVASGMKLHIHVAADGETTIDIEPSSPPGLRYLPSIPTPGTIPFPYQIRTTPSTGDGWLLDRDYVVTSIGDEP